MDVLFQLFLKALWFVMDWRFLLGQLVGWKLVTQVFGRPDAEDEAALKKQLQDQEALVASLNERLAQQEAELQQRERALADASSRLGEAEFARLTLEAQVTELEAKGVRLEADLEAGVAKVTAENSRLASANATLQEENEAVLGQLRGLLSQAGGAAEPAAAAGGESAQRAATPAGASPAGEGGEAARLQEENEGLRAQLEAVVAQNADLQERLMALAFQPPAEPAEGTFSPEPRRPRHRPLAEDEEIQRRIAESAAQVALLAEGEAGSDGQPSSPLLAAAQRQLAAYQQIKERLAFGGAGAGGAASDGEGEGEAQQQEGPTPALSATTSTDQSPALSGSPMGVLGSAVAGGLTKGLSAAAEAAEGEEVSSSALA